MVTINFILIVNFFKNEQLINSSVVEFSEFKRITSQSKVLVNSRYRNILTYLLTNPADAHACSQCSDPAMFVFC